MAVALNRRRASAPEICIWAMHSINANATYALILLMSPGTIGSYKANAGISLASGKGCQSGLRAATDPHVAAMQSEEPGTLACSALLFAVEVPVNSVGIC